MIQFAYTILYVQDVEKAITFYEQAFGFARKFAMPDYAELITGNTILSFASLKLAKTNLKDGFTEASLSDKPFAIEIGFSTDDVAGTYAAALAAGATPLAEAAVKPHGQMVAYMRDLDGFLVEICSPMG